MVFVTLGAQCLVYLVNLKGKWALVVIFQELAVSSIQVILLFALQAEKQTSHVRLVALMSFERSVILHSTADVWGSFYHSKTNAHWDSHSWSEMLKIAGFHIASITEMPEMV